MAKSKRKPTRTVDQRILDELERIATVLEGIQSQLMIGIDVSDSKTQSKLDDIELALARSRGNA